ncbi:MAG: PepSY domain-containing protein [Oscillospiraceae bacterium]|nr:PepSY domain-containing protein [Oscillospiraceae bacterium]
MKNINESAKLNDQELENVVGGISQDDALAAALKHANLDKSQVEFIKRIELDYEHGRKVYEIKFYQGRCEYEFDIDADTGDVLKFEKDWD